MNLWNKRDLSHPPINTCKTTSRDIDIQYMSNVIREAKSFIEDNNYFQVEHAVLSRITYRMKLKFRTSKDFKTIEKLKKALDRYFEIDLPTSLQNFIDLIPSHYKAETYLPTKNLLDYILIRMQGMVKVLERIVESAKIAAPLLENRLNIGHFWQIAFILYATVSRVYVLSKYAATRICEHYNKIRPFSRKLENTGKNIVPDNQPLPTDLKEWLNVDWLDLDDEVQIIEEVSKMPDILDFFNLVEDEDIEFCDEYFLLDSDDDDDDTEAKKSGKTKVKSQVQSGDDEDVEIVDIIDGTVQRLKEIMTNKNKKTKSGFFRGFEDEDKGEVIEITDSYVENRLKKEEENIIDGKRSLEVSIVSLSGESGDSDTPEEAHNSVVDVNTVTPKADVIVLSETEISPKKNKLKKIRINNSNKKIKLKKKIKDRISETSDKLQTTKNKPGSSQCSQKDRRKFKRTCQNDEHYEKFLKKIKMSLKKETNNSHKQDVKVEETSIATPTEKDNFGTKKKRNRNKKRRLSRQRQEINTEVPAKKFKLDGMMVKCEGQSASKTTDAVESNTTPKLPKGQIRQKRKKRKKKLKEIKVKNENWT